MERFNKRVEYSDDEIIRAKTAELANEGKTLLVIDEGTTYYAQVGLMVDEDYCYGVRHAALSEAIDLANMHLDERAGYEMAGYTLYECEQRDGVIINKYVKETNQFDPDSKYVATVYRGGYGTKTISNEDRANPPKYEYFDDTDGTLDDRIEEYVRSVQNPQRRRI